MIRAIVGTVAVLAGFAVLERSVDASTGQAGLCTPTEAYALLLARTAQKRFGSVWALSETGATGPTGNRYGDAAGHSCFAVVGKTDGAWTLETCSSDRVANMRAFAAAALDHLADALR